MNPPDVHPLDFNTVIQVTRNGMGNAEPELQKKLIVIYFRLLLESDSLPAVISFYGEGVLLAVEGSPALVEMAQFEARGVTLQMCSTCLNYYNVLDRVKVGVVGGMTDILEAQLMAKKVITL